MPNANVHQDKEEQRTAFFPGTEGRSNSILALLQRFENTTIEDQRLLNLAVQAFDLGHYIRAASLFDQLPPSSPLYAVAKWGEARSYLSQATGVSRYWQKADPLDRHNNQMIRNMEAVENRIRQYIAMITEENGHE